MTRLRWLVGIAVVLALAYGVMIAVYTDARPWRGAERQRSSAAAAASRRRAAFDPADYDEVVVTLVIPARADVPTGGAHGGSCPQDQLCNILGVRLAQPHGLVVGTVVPDGPADKAGIKPGDRLAAPTECPAKIKPKNKNT